MFVDKWRELYWLVKMMCKTGILILCCFVVFVKGSTFSINQHTCTTRENRITFVIETLVCSYRGPGLYVYDGPTSVKRIEFDRMTAQSHVRIPTKYENIKEIEIMMGPTSCEIFSSPPHVTVKIEGIPCVSKLKLSEVHKMYSSNPWNPPLDPPMLSICSIIKQCFYYCSSF